MYSVTKVCLCVFECAWGGAGGGGDGCCCFKARFTIPNYANLKPLIIENVHPHTHTQQQQEVRDDHEKHFQHRKHWSSKMVRVPRFSIEPWIGIHR